MDKTHERRILRWRAGIRDVDILRDARGTVAPNSTESETRVCPEDGSDVEFARDGARAPALRNISGVQKPHVHIKVIVFGALKQGSNQLRGDPFLSNVTTPPRRRAQVSRDGQSGWQIDSDT